MEESQTHCQWQTSGDKQTPEQGRKLLMTKSKQGLQKIEIYFLESLILHAV